MINRKNYVWTLSLAFLLAACGNDEGATAVYENAYPVVVTAQNVAFEVDEASIPYPKGENLGVSMLEEGTENLVEPYFNIRFNSGGVGSYFTVEATDSIPVFPSTGEARDLVAYYPRVAEIADNQISVDLSVNQDLAFKLQFDRLSGLNKDNREAAFKMKHVFAMISTEITPEVSYAAMMVEVKDTPIKGSLNVLNGTLTQSETGTLTLSDVSTMGRAKAISSSGNFRTMLFPAQSLGSTEGEATAETPIIVITLLDTNNTPIANPIEVKVADYIATISNAINTKFEIAIDANFVPTVKVTSYPITVEDWEISGEIGVEGNEQTE